MRRSKPDAVRLWVACASVLLLHAVAFAQTLSPATTPYRGPYQPLRTFQQPATPINAAEVGQPIAPKADVQTSGTIAVIGAVEHPGTFALSSGHHYLEAISAAGGPSADADRGVKVIRRGQVLMPLFDPKTTTAADAKEFGQLQPGDVIVVRPKIGVRTAYVETDRQVDAYGQSPEGQRPAQVERPVHVACLGLIDHPVVLSVDPQKPVLRLFVMETLGLPESVVSQVKLLAAAGGVPREGLLSDGCTLIFPEQLAAGSMLDPQFSFPSPKPLVSERREVVQPGTPLRIPGVPFLARETSTSRSTDLLTSQPQTTAQLPLPQTVSEQSDTDFRANEPSGTTPVTSLFEKPSESTPGLALNPRESLPRLHRGVVTAGGLLSDGDISPTTLTPSASLNTGSIFASQPSISTADPSTTAAPSTAATQGNSLVAGVPTLEGSTTSWGEILTSNWLLGTLGVMSLICLIGAQIWGYQQRRAANADASRPTTAVASTPALPTRKEPPTPLELLIANQLPIIEEPTQVSLLPRYQGRSIGGKKLIINEAHAAVPAPHAPFTRSQRPRRDTQEAVAASQPAATRQSRPSVASQGDAATRSGSLNTSSMAGLSPGEPLTSRSGPTENDHATPGIQFSKADFSAQYDTIQPPGHTGSDIPPRVADGGLLERVLLAAQRERKPS
ncbi:MAG: SLBB domain-containing protein [Planctomycetaceae bacterium]